MRTCTVCGETKEESEFKRHRIPCRVCCLEKHKERMNAKYKNDPEYRRKAKARAAAWRTNNPDLLREQWNRWEAANPEKVRASQKLCRANSIQELRPAYVANYLAHGRLGCRVEDLPERLVEAYAAWMRIRRLLKEKSK